MSQGVKTLRVLDGREPASSQVRENVVLVNADGEPVDIGGGASGPSQDEFDALVARVEALESAADA